MEWIQFLAYLAAIFTGIRWLLSEFKIYKTQTDKDWKEVHMTIKNIGTEIQDINRRFKERGF